MIASVLDADVGGSDQQLHESEDQLRLLVGRHHGRGPLRKREIQLDGPVKSQ
jgi:hypothetical protein